MIELELNRKYKKPEYTIGVLSCKGKFFCNILEDVDRGLTKEMPLEKIKNMKVYGKTAIPAGRYEVDLTLSRRFGRQLPILLNVPGFSGIRIHRGNTADDSSGCLLPGENSEKGKVVNSSKWEKFIVGFIRQAKERGEKCYINIR